MLHALPMDVARQFVAAHARFHSADTTDSERETLVCDVLSAIRLHDPDVSIWELLSLFDRPSL